MTNYVIDGHDLSKLFDESSSPISFSEDPREHIPNKGSIIYSVWNKDKKFIYIGISGLQKSLEKRSPLSRMISHASGRRSGDQFCIYIHDFYVIPKLIEKGKYSPSIGFLDKLLPRTLSKTTSHIVLQGLRLMIVTKLSEGWRTRLSLVLLVSLHY